MLIKDLRENVLIVGQRLAFFYQRGVNLLVAAALLASMMLPILVTKKAAAATTGYSAKYWNLLAPSGSPTFPTSEPDLTRTDNEINYNWWSESPDPSINVDGFAAEWTKTASFDAGFYQFRTRSDDGVRVYLDDQLIIDSWSDQGGNPHAISREVTAGNHDIRVQYYENQGFALISFDYIKMIGAGTTNDPFMISDCLQLQNLKYDLTATYKLANNIDCTDTVNWNSGAGFEPIGSLTGYFTGALNGNNKVIYGLYHNGGNEVGLFGVIGEMGQVYDLGLKNVNINSNSNVGALAGISAGTITNSYSTGNVMGGNYVGGLVGYHTEESGIGSSSPLVYTWDGSKYSYVADVGHTIPINKRGNDSVAIAGNSLQPKDGVYKMKISQEYDEIVYYDELALKTYDTTPGYQVVPQIDLLNTDKGIAINKTPTVAAQSCVDMFGNNCLAAISAVDDNWTHQDLATNINSFEMNFGDLSSSAQKVLILNGVRDFTKKASKSLKSIEVKDANGKWVNALGANNQLNSLKGAPRTVALEMSNMFLTNDYSVKISYDRAQLNYVAMDTSPTQSFTEAVYHPSSADLQFRGYTNFDKSGPYWKHDYYDLKSYPNMPFSVPSGNFTKYGDVATLLQSTNDQHVVMHHGDSMDVNFAYNPVPNGKERSFILYNWVEYKHAGSESWTHSVDPLPFKGMSKYPYEAPEAYPDTVSNRAYLAEWNTRYYAGNPNDGHHTIINSYSSATVHGSNFIGGLVGMNRAKLITGSHASGDVVSVGGCYIGGLVGWNSNGSTPGEITDSYATGNVSAVSGSCYEGGLVGFNTYSNITRSYATGNVNGVYGVGGLVGYSYSNNINAITDSYATGNVSASTDYSGGLVGYIYNMNVSNTYAIGQVTSIGEHVGGLAAVDGGGNVIKNSFWDVDSSMVSVLGDNSGLGKGKTTAEMKNVRNFTDLTFNADLSTPVWDFNGSQFDDSATNNVWKIDAEHNNNYPYLANGPVPAAMRNNGDANNDGIDDESQSNVTGYMSPVTDDYVILQSSSECSDVFSNIATESKNEVADAGYDYPAGLMNFTLNCTVGATATITQYYFGNYSASSYIARKYNSVSHSYTTIPGAVVSNVTIGGQKALKIVYQITDGGSLDQDGLVNGVIVDPSGPAQSTVGAPNTGLGGAVMQHSDNNRNYLVLVTILLVAALGTRRLQRNKSSL